MGRGNVFWGVFTQGGARSALALGYYQVVPTGLHFASPREHSGPTDQDQRSAELARNLTEKLLAYALCRQLEGYDEIVLDHLMEIIAKDGYRMQTLITEIVTSYPFTYRSIQGQIASSSHEK